MACLSRIDLILIKAVKPRGYIYNGDVDAVAKQKRKTFFQVFTKVVNKKHELNMTESQVKARWRKIREAYVRMDQQERKGKKKLTDFQQEVKEQCCFLQEHISHSKPAPATTPQPHCADENQVKGARQDHRDLDDEDPEALDMNAEQEYVDEEYLDCVDDDEAGHVEPQVDENLDDDPMANAAQYQHELEALCQEAVAESSGKKRGAIENLTADFSKKLKNTNNNSTEVIDAHLKRLSLKISELAEKNEIMLKAKARAILICSYLDRLEPAMQIVCIQKVLEILKKYE